MSDPTTTESRARLRDLMESAYGPTTAVWPPVDRSKWRIEFATAAVNALPALLDAADERDALAAQVAAMREALTVWAALNKLRQPEGATVTFMCDNPDFNGLPNCAVEVNDEWTGWVDRRFTGETVAAAMSAALAAREAK